MRFSITVFVLAATAVSNVLAQYQPGRNYNVTLLGQLDQYGGYSNIWGYTDGAGNEYALVGADLGLSIVNITDPRNPVEVDFVPGPPSAWREIKTYSNYAYVVSEATQPNHLTGIQIVDLSPLPDSARYLGVMRWPNVNATTARAHTISVDEAGHLYIQGGTATQGAANQGGVRILSLASPAAPTTVGLNGSRYVHDSFIKNNLLFNSNIYDGGHVDIFNISDRANPRFLTSITYPQGFSHNAGTTDDGNYLITTDEAEGYTVKVWDIHVLWDGDSGNDNNIELVAEYISDPAHIAHNVHVKGDYAYIAHYTEGVTVLDIADPTKPAEIGYYDTIDEPFLGFDGVWGVYPYFPSGTFVVSDMSNGLFVLKLDQSLRGGSISGFVLEQTTGNPIAQAAVKFIEAGKALVADAGGLFLQRTFEGHHTVAASAFGYLPDTLEANVSAGGEEVLIFNLSANTAAMAVSVDSVRVELEIGKSTQQKFVVRNSGGGVLNFEVRDLVGPLPTANAAALVRQKQKISWSKFDYAAKMKTNFTEPKPSMSRGLSPDLKTILVDPAGDVAHQPDVVAIRAAKDSAQVTMQVVLNGRLRTNDFGGAISLDVDQDITTGLYPPVYGIPTQDIGAEFAVLTFGLSQGIVDLYALPSFNFIGAFPAVVDSNSFIFSLPLSVLNHDEGNMNVTALFGDSREETDWVPDVGHGTIGVDINADVTWLTEAPTAASLRGGEAQEITLSFDANGLKPDTVYAGIVLVEPLGVNLAPQAIQIQLATKPAPSAVHDARTQIPATFALGPNAPNPFNPSTLIHYQLPREAEVGLTIFDLQGRMIRRLVSAEQQAGYHSASWDGKDEHGQPVGSGVYLYQMRAGNFSQTRKMLMIK
ncbi:choice-of-anchor B family protein [candidate division KSB1 bacterium]|nr:choice-of-anchor B family protein [candidate division KSB1 bacterium]